jgi:DNA-binding response OmpR family regulator
VSRRLLLADAWDVGVDPGTNLVDVCVSRLRRKLGPGAPVETVRNVGYRIVVSDD